MTSTPSPSPPVEPRRSDLTELWGEGISAGFTAVPNALIRAQKNLGLTANDMVVLLNLLMHRWYGDSQPFPRPASIAKRSGLSTRTVQRSLSHLAEIKLIQRLANRTVVETSDTGAKKYRKPRARYDLTGLRERIEARALKDKWYRPTVVTKTPVGTRAKEQTGRPNPSPE